MRLVSHILFFLFSAWQLIAQTYPVQVVPVLAPPYSSKIADYANPMANKVQLQLITTDLSVQNRLVQLYVEIKGNGLTAASTPVLSGVSPLRINGGEILRLTDAELAPYFQLRNLQGITSEQYASPLPDGAYTFCFRVKDVLSGRWLSQHQCMVAYLMLNDPPILNIPTDNEQVAVTDFQNIIFSWTPRQINATNVTYSFELREILDPTLDPHFAFEVSRRILKEDDLRMTTFVYDVSKPNLIPGRRYAWRVRAISTGGLAENSVFKNNGYSEVHSFVYAVNCSKPLFLLSQQQSKSRTKLLWQGDTQHQKYHIQYRKKGVAEAQWFDTSTRNTQALITDLEAGEYEFRVGATCETERYGITPSYVYSDIQTFEIEKVQNTTESAYNCGIVPKIAITNQKPLGSLVTNEVFTAGDFSVTILEVSGSNGIFSGKGFVKVPYLNDTKLAVEFENIKINTDYQLTDGIVKTIYDSDWKGVQFAENLIGQGKKSKDIEVPFEIEKVETHNGEIVVTGKDGRKEVFPFGGNDSSIKGKVTTTTNGVTSTQEKIYHIDKGGKVSEPQTVAQGGKPTKENTNGVSKNGEATALTAKGIEVTFENTADSKYAYEVPTKAYSKDYQKFDGKYIPFKAVVKGETEPFLAKVHITDKNISADSLIFKTDKGALIESKRVEGSNDFLLTLKGFHSFAVEQVQATIKQGKKYQIAGAFNLVHLSPKTAKVILVPTSENTSMDIDRVKSIYSKIGVTLDITWAAPFDITPYLTNGVLETKDVFGDLTDYSLSQQALINAYKATGKVANDTYYVFITNAKSSTGQGGYMALGGQFGFVFDQTERTLAHELGHGIFKLAHPFKKKQQGNVPSLMDYTSDEALLFADWKQINDPAFKIGIFQGQEEGEDFFKKNSFVMVQRYIEYFRCTRKQKGTIFADTDKVDVYAYNITVDNTKYEKIIIEFLKEDKQSVGFAPKNYRSDSKKIESRSKDKIVVTFGGTIRFSIFSENYSNLIDYLYSDNDKYVENVKDILSNISAYKGGDKAAFEYINSLDVCTLSSIDFDTIRKVLKVLTDTKLSLTDTREKAIIRILSSLKENDFPKFIALLKEDNYKVFDRLYTDLDDAVLFYGNDNYTGFVKFLIEIYKKANADPSTSQEIIKELTEETNDFSIILNIAPIDTRFFQRGWYDPEQRKVSVYVMESTMMPIKTTHGQDFILKDIKKEKIGDLSPLSYVLIYKTDSGVPQIEATLGETDTSTFYYAVPAIFLDYYQHKKHLDKIEKDAAFAFDMLTIGGSGGLALATKISKVRRVWAAIEVIGAVGNIAVNTAQSMNANLPFAKAVHYYNLAMGVIGIKNITQLGYGVAKNLAKNVKDNAKLLENYEHWQREVAQLDNLPQAERQLIEKQREVWRALGLENSLEQLSNYKELSSLLKTLSKNAIDKLLKGWDVDLLKALEKDLLSKTTGAELKKLLQTEDDFLKWKLLKEDPAYAFELSKENSSWTKWGKSNFFKTNTQLGRQFESLVSSKIRNIPPFSTLYKDYTHLKQVYLKGVKDNIIADDLFVKELRDERGRSYFRAIISDSKLKATSPWTANQKSELIDVFKNNPNKKYIEFEVRSSKSELQKFNLPENFSTGSRVRIYREDVYKIISEGDNIKIPPIKMNDINFK